MSTSLPPDSDSQTLLLPCGRTLGYAIYGLSPSPTNAHPTVFYFHGFPGSRLEAALIPASLPLTIIAPDRPGNGLSTFQPGRRVLDWPADVLALAAHLKVGKFYAVGVSGGAPYALACAREFPRERLLGTAVVSGAYPLDCGTEGMLFGIRVFLTLGGYLPTFLISKLMDWEFGNSARNPDKKVLEDMVMGAMSKRPEKDRVCLEDERVRTVVVESMREAFRGKSSEGVAWDLGLYSNWGFGLEEVSGEGVVLWHGGGDVNAPAGMAREAGRRIRGCQVRVLEEETHLSLSVNHVEGILRALVGLTK